MMSINEWLFLDAEKLPPQPVLKIQTLPREYLIELSDADLNLSEVNSPEDVIPPLHQKETK